MARSGYVYGEPDDEEVWRLVRQARFVATFSLDTFEAPPGARVLDVGTGVGAMAAQIVRLCPGIDLTAVDISEAQLVRARALHPVATHVRAEAASLPFADGFFDRVHMSWVLEHVREPLAILREVRRVLRRGGISARSITTRSWWSRRSRSSPADSWPSRAHARRTCISSPPIASDPRGPPTSSCRTEAASSTRTRAWPRASSRRSRAVPSSPCSRRSASTVPRTWTTRRSPRRRCTRSRSRSRRSATSAAPTATRSRASSAATPRTWSARSPSGRSISSWAARRGARA